MARFSAFFDACVLYSPAITDIVMEVAASGLFRPLWSPAVQDEWVRNVIANRPDLPPERVSARRLAMDTFMPASVVTGYGNLLADLTLPDPDDRHVLAAAIVGRADVIVTFNLADSPQHALGSYGLEAQHPDVFLNHQRTLDEPLFISSVKRIRSRLTGAAAEPEGYIENLRSLGLQVIAAELDKVRSLI